MKRLILIIFVSLLTYFTADFLYSKKKAFYNISYFSKGCIKNSFIFGYEYFPNKNCRHKRVMKGYVEYDNFFKVNNKGFVSNFDYHFSREKVRRAVALGFSMTEGNYIKKNWPSRATEISKGNLEVLNFARAGYFNLNLYSIYFNKLHKYEFDYLLLPKIGATEYQFMVFEEKEDGVYDGVFKNLPVSQKNYDKDFSGKLSPMYSFFKSDDDFSLKKDFSILYKNLIIGKKIYSKMLTSNLVKKRGEDFRILTEFKNHPIEFDNLFGRRNVLLYLSIISDALRKNRKIIFYQDPLKGVKPELSKKDNTYKLYSWLKNIKPGLIYYYDGNDAFLSEGIDDTKDFFFKNDGHWNQKGSDLFAKHLSIFLTKLD